MQKQNTPAFPKRSPCVSQKRENEKFVPKERSHQIFTINPAKRGTGS